MLPDIVAEVLHFVSRRDLDKACGVSKWLDAIIAQCCAVYPFRPVRSVSLHSRRSDIQSSRHFVFVETNGGLQTNQTFCSMDEAALFVGCVLRNLFVEILEISCNY